MRVGKRERERERERGVNVTARIWNDHLQEEEVVKFEIKGSKRANWKKNVFWMSHFCTVLNSHVVLRFFAAMWEKNTNFFENFLKKCFWSEDDAVKVYELVDLMENSSCSGLTQIKQSIKFWNRIFVSMPCTRCITRINCNLNAVSSHTNQSQFFSATSEKNMWNVQAASKCIKEKQSFNKYTK